MAYSPWGRKESDMTEQLSTAQHILGQARLRSQNGLGKNEFLYTKERSHL